MSYRTISGIIVAIAVVIEVFLFMGQPIPTKQETTQNGKWFGKKTVTDYESKDRNDQRYFVLIGSTILVGGILAFSLPSKKIKSEDETEENSSI